MHCNLLGKNAVYRLSTATTDGPKGTSHLRMFATDTFMLNKTQVIAAFMSLYPPAMPCSCPFIHLQNKEVRQNRHKFLGFCVKSALLLECVFCLVLSPPSAPPGRLAWEISPFHLLLFCSWGIPQSLLLLVKGWLLKWSTI